MTGLKLYIVNILTRSESVFLRPCSFSKVELYSMKGGNMKNCENHTNNLNDFNSIELHASSISFKIDNCSYLNLQNKIISILNESNVTVEDLDNLIQFLIDSKKTATLKF